MIGITLILDGISLYMWYWFWKENGIPPIKAILLYGLIPLIAGYHMYYACYKDLKCAFYVASMIICAIPILGSILSVGKGKKK